MTRSQVLFYGFSKKDYFFFICPCGKIIFDLFSLNRHVLNNNNIQSHDYASIFKSYKQELHQYLLFYHHPPKPEIDFEKDILQELISSGWH